MLKDGLYELFYRASKSKDGSFESMMLVLRSGKILAADHWGGVYLGSSTFDPKSRNHRIKINMQVPPGGLLITDDRPCSESRLIHIDANISKPDDDELTLIEIEGQPVEITLKFRGRLPTS